MNDTKLKQVIDTSLGNIKDILDVNTVIGEPIPTAGGTVIIPVSKISMGFATGGSDYATKNTADKTGNFVGGGGTGVTMSPIGFLVTKADGSVEFMPVAKSSGGGAAYKPDTIETVLNFVENSPELVKKFKDLFAKDKTDDDGEAETEEESGDSEESEN